MNIKLFLMALLTSMAISCVVVAQPKEQIIQPKNDCYAISVAIPKMQGTALQLQGLFKTCVTLHGKYDCLAEGAVYYATARQLAGMMEFEKKNCTSH